MDIDTWLNGIGLGQYTELFRSNELDASLLRRLNGDDLKEMGIAALGHRKRLLEAIAALDAAPDAGTAAPAAAAAPTASSTAERRHLTVMFCDLVGSTALSGQLDPEDLQGVIRSYHAAVAQAVAPYGGHVAQLLGDGALVYFGYPSAHEDDAVRAVHAGFAVLKAVAALSPQADTRLQTRVGIATGLVVVGEVGTGTPAADQTASGETPNLAARLQGQAQPGEIVIADDTRKLVGQSFVLESLGALDLKGFAVPTQAWRVNVESKVPTRFEAQHMQGLVEFIGRDSEVALLLDRWALARDGEGQVVLLSGEAGIGKSRICQTLRERLAGDSVATVLLQCSPYFSSSALYPVVQHLERTAGMAAADPPDLRAHKLEQLAGALRAISQGCLLRLMGLPDGGRSAPGGGSPQEEKVHTLEALIELLQRLCEKQPVLFLLEDAHWIDPTTEELIGQAAQLVRDQRVLLLVTCRPEYAPSWGNTAQLTRHSLSRLSHRQCTALVNAVTAGKSLPADVLAEIIYKTDGIPLFIEELTKTVLQSGLLEDTPTGYHLIGPLPRFAIPATLQDSLMARLDRLAPAKEVAQVGAAIGREFAHRLLAEVLSAMPVPKLDAALADLVRSELVFRRGTPPDATYSFNHALVRDTAYNSMLKSQRVLRHGQIAAALEQGQRDLVASQPELLAFHHQEGGNANTALRYWQAAGDSAMARSAVREAVSHYQAAIALLETLQASEPCADVELSLRLKLASAAFETEGFTSASASESCARARDLAVALDRPDEHIQACGGIAGALSVAGRFADAIEMLDQFGPAQLARVKPMSRINLLIRLGYIRTLRGELTEAGSTLAEARRELEDVRSEEWQPLGLSDPPVAVLMLLRMNLTLRGHLSSADACAREGLDIAERRQHSNSRVWALQQTALMSDLKGDHSDVIVRCTQALELAVRYGLKAYGALAKSYLGGALIATGQQGDGMRTLREGYSGWTTFGGNGSSVAAYAARVLLDAGRRDEAAEFMRAGEKAQQDSEEKFQAARFLSLRGRFAELDGDCAAAAAAYRQAIEIAEHQGALLYSLGAATSLALLWQSQGRADDADAVLRPIYDKFTEGFDYPDLMRAKALLDARS